MNLHLDVRIPRRPHDVEVRADLTTEMAGLFGPSGSGKSSLLQAICGLERKTRGRIVLGGEVLQDSAVGVFVPPHKRSIGMCFQDDRLLPHLSVKKNLLYGYRRTPPGVGSFLPDQVAELLEISDLLDRRPAQLSGGQRQRVALGRALLCRPRLLLLDEPLAGLDVGLRRQILPFLRRVRRVCNLPMILVSHELVDILELTDHLMILQKGALLGNAGLLELIRDERILPLLHEMGLQNVLRLEVLRQDPQDGVTLCRLSSSAHGKRTQSDQILLPLTEASAGEEISVCLSGRAVTLALLPAGDLSIQNRLSAQIVDLVTAQGRCVCVLDAGGQKLLAEITLRARRELGLCPGQRVWCLFKSHSLRRLEG